MNKLVVVVDAKLSNESSSSISSPVPLAPQPEIPTTAATVVAIQSSHSEENVLTVSKKSENVANTESKYSFHIISIHIMIFNIFIYD